MKHLIFSFSLVVISFTNAFSQECTTMWPYIYPEFNEGTLYMDDGNEFNAKFNVHIQESRLHYLDNGIIKETRSENIVLVKIGDDIFMNVQGQVMKVIGSEKRGFVATLILGDFDKVLNSSGAYGGSSSSSATMKLSSIDVGGKSIINHMELKKNKEEGITVPLIYKYFIVTKGNVYHATKRGIRSELNQTENIEFKNFLKKNKIKWKDPQSLMSLLDFFNR